MTASTLPTKHRGPDRRIWTRDNIAINALGIAFIGLFALACLIPFYLIVIASFTPEASLIRDGYPIIPHSFDLQSYALCIKNPTSVLLAYANTIGVTLIGTIMSILLCTMTGYVLSRKELPGKNLFMVYFMITTFLDLILRVVLAFILVHPFGITGIWLSWPFGWIISSTLSLAFYLLGVWDPLKKKA